MVSTAPTPTDVSDFQFKLHCKLNVFENTSSADFSTTSSLVAAASRYGLLFVGTNSNSFQVIQHQDIDSLSVKDKEVSSYNKRIVQLTARPQHLSINCDSSKLSVVIEEAGCPKAIVYNVLSFLSQNICVIKEIRLSATPGVFITETDWNPSLPYIYTACKSDGSLGLYEFKGDALDIHELPAASGATCFCWSPKGKQIAVGARNGSITQYKPDLKAVKVVNGPSLQGNQSIITLKWMSSFQFVGVYKDAEPDSTASIIVIDAPKTGSPVYTNYDDITYSNGASRPCQFYMIAELHWNVLMVASSNGMEVGVLGVENEKWIQWIMGDSSRAELPLSSKKRDTTLPIGVTLFTGSTRGVVKDDNKLPPAPMLMMLSDHGLLCCFDVINSRPGVMSVCSPPEPVVDKSGLNLFTTNEPKQVTNITAETTISAVKAPFATNKPLSFVSPSEKTASAPLLQLPTTISSTVPNATKPQQQPTIGLFGRPAVDSSTIKTITAPTSGNMPFKVPTYRPITSDSDTYLPTLLPTTAAPVIQPISAPSSPPETPKKRVSEGDSTPLRASDRLPVNAETDAMIAQLVREECITLERELKMLLHRGRSINIEIDKDNAATDMSRKALSLEEFLNDLKETSSSLESEIHTLKQTLMQAWAWYEEARERFTTSQDPDLKTLLLSQPLDPASKRLLDEIEHLVYYLDSQLTQANGSLDEQWDNFQDSIKKNDKIRMPTMEAIYQSMVKQNATLQKQKYLLKDISSRLKSQKKIQTTGILVSLHNVCNLEDHLKKLQLNPNSGHTSYYTETFNRQNKLTQTKSQKLYQMLSKRTAAHISVNKPQLNNSTLHLASLLNSPVVPKKENLSPIPASRKVHPIKIDFSAKTSRPGSVPEVKPKVGITSTPLPKVDLSKQVTNNQQQASASAVRMNWYPTVAETLTTTSVTNVVSPAPTTATNFRPDASKTAFTSSKSKVLPSGGGFLNTEPLVTTSATPFTMSAWKPAPVTAASNVSVAGSGGFLNSDNLITTSATPTTMSVWKPTLTVTAALNPSVTGSGDFFTTETLITTSVSAWKPPAMFAAAINTSVAGNTGFFNETLITTSATPPTMSAWKPTSVPAATPSASVAVTPLIISSQPASSPGGSSMNSTNKTPLFGNPVPISGSLFGSSAQAVSNTTSTFGFPTIKPTATAATVIGTTTTFTSKTPVSMFGAALLASANPELTDNSVFTPVSTSVSTTSALTSLLNYPKTTAAPFFGMANISSSVPTASIATITPVSTSTTKASAFGSKPLSITAPTSTVASVFTAASEIAKPIATTTLAMTSFMPTKPIDAFSVFAPVTVSSNTDASATSIFGSSANNSNAVTSAICTEKANPTVFTTTSTIPSLFASSTTSSSSSAWFGSNNATSVFQPAKPAITSAEDTIGSTTTTSMENFAGTSVASMTTSSSSISQPASVFGNATTFTSVDNKTVSPFTGSQTSIFGTTSSSVFNSIQASSVFGNTTAPITSSPFGNASPVTSSAFPTDTSTFGTPFQTTPTVSSAFGSATAFVKPTATPFSGSAFGQQQQQNNAFASNSFFGSTPSTTSTGSVFAQTTPAFGSSTNTSVFGAATATAPSPFGSAPAFGTPVSTNTNPFGGSPFGATSTASSPFASASPASPFSTATTATSPFGTTAATTNSAFGNSGQGVFGSKQSAFGSSFGTPSTTTSSAFGFGSLNVGTPTTTSAFGSSSAFGQQPNPFGRAPSPPQSSPFGGNGSSNNSSIFRTPTAPFGAASSPNSSFVQPSTFGGGSGGSFSQTSGAFSSGGQTVQQAGFGSPTFQKTASPGGFGSAPVFGSSPSFGSPATFGGSSAFGGTPSFGTPPKNFGTAAPTAGPSTFGNMPQNATFGNLANQNTLGFGNLASQASSQQQQSSFTSGASFSSWR